MMTLTGHEGVTGPTKVGFWVCDMATGMTAAFAVSAAIAHKRGTGEGAYIDLSMLDVAASFISPMATKFYEFRHDALSHGEWFARRINCFIGL